ncbi:MAG: DUF5666 domain-containing protein [bacterium]
MRKLMSKSACCLLIAALVALALGGCSRDGIVEPNQTSASLSRGVPSPDQVSLSDQLQLEGRVATVEAATRTLTLVGVAESIVAATDCEILTMVAGVETILEFEDIQVGDSARVCGAVQEDGSILAQRIRIFCESDCQDCYLVFRDSIATIDYASGTFTVFGRTETITVDDATIIWTNLGQHGQALGLGDGPADDHGKNKIKCDTILTFTDLFVGALVEVKTTVIDPNTLYAASIKLAPCSLRECVDFDATLATVDIDSRVVTFDGLAWIGNVCPGAELIGTSGEPLTLADFVAGELVKVKGSPLTEDTLKISRLEKI